MFLVYFHRGFGFVTYVDAASVDNVLAQPHHELDSKTVCLISSVTFLSVCAFVTHLPGMIDYVVLNCVFYGVVICYLN